MDRMPWAMYLWPGLPQLWRQGNWSALARAVGFAALVNLALAASLLWSELFTPGVRSGAWLAVAVVWGGSVWLSYRWDRRHPAGPIAVSAEDGFGEALDHYLKGNWFEAERVLGSLLRRNPRDLDAGLMLGTLFRHTGRIEEVQRELERLERFEGSQKWEWEIGRERELLQEALSADAAEPVGAPQPGLAEPPEKMLEAA